MKFAYADPPYIGQAKRHYGSGEVDHDMLIEKLQRDYHGWALSLSSPSLLPILRVCPPDTRDGAYVMPWEECEHIKHFRQNLEHNQITIWSEHGEPDGWVNVRCGICHKTHELTLRELPEFFDETS